MKSKLRILWISSIDKGGIAAAYCNAINKYTPHSAVSVALYEKFGFEQDVVFNRNKWGCFNMKPPDYWSQVLSALTAQCDIIVVTIGSDIKSHDKSKKEYDLCFDVGDGRTYNDILPLVEKKVVAFLPGSDQFYENMNYYIKLCKTRQWPVITCQPYLFNEIKKRYANCQYVPMLIDMEHPRYRNSIFHFLKPDQFKTTKMFVGYSPLSTVDHNFKLLEDAIQQINEEQGSGERPPDLGFASRIINEQSFVDSLNTKKMCQVGFDRVLLDRPTHGLSSIENMAIGLVNLVYLRDKEINVIKDTMGTIPPWFIVNSQESIVNFLKSLSDKDILLKQREAYDYARSSWHDRDFIGKVVDSLLV